MGNELATNTVKSLTTTLSSDVVKNKVNAIIGDEKKGAKFISSLTSMINQNPALAECEQASLINSALVGFALELSPQLQQFYVVPFKDTRNNRTVATYQMGWKGYWQLAMRSGQYKSLNVSEVREGEKVNFDRLSGQVQVSWIDDAERETKKVIGYVAYFQLLNGFEKAIYWDHAKMKAHAEKYSLGYRSDIQKGTKYTFWSKDFDGMAFKTLIRQLISKYGVMSIEMETAYRNDMAAIEDNGVAYVDNVTDLKEQVATEANKQPIPTVKSDANGVVEEKKPTTDKDNIDLGF
jgi:recombination protein RecT